MTGSVVTCAWLAEHLHDSGIRVVDTRWYLGEPGAGRRRYEEDHIPGAVFLDLDDDLAAPVGPGRHPLPTPADFGATLGGYGIGNRHHVVAYDQGPGSIAARLWWMLRNVGHHRVSVLDGGFLQWTTTARVTTRAEPGLHPTTFEVGQGSTSTIDRYSLLSRLGAVQVIDARDSDRYRGEVERVDAAAGHIPTSISAPTGGNLNSEGLFKSPEELMARFDGLGVDPAVPIVSLCGSGVTACHNILALHMAGYPEGILYPGSWSDWSSAGFRWQPDPDPDPHPLTLRRHSSTTEPFGSDVDR